jgi:hypothetical protein
LIGGDVDQNKKVICVCERRPLFLTV